jgi:transposase
MTRSKTGKAKRNRRSYSTEFKAEAVRLMRERRALGVSLAQVGRELEIRPSLLRAWSRQIDGGGVATGRDGLAAAGSQLSVEEELRRVRRENAVLRQERDFLKKAAAFFAKESR